MVNPVSLFYTVLFPRFVCVKLCNLTEIIVILSLSSFFYLLFQYKHLLSPVLFFSGLNTFWIFQWVLIFKAGRPIILNMLVPYNYTQRTVCYSVVFNLPK